MMYDQVNGIPWNVIEVLTPLRKKHDFLHIENPEALFYELRSTGHEDVAEYLDDGSGTLDREKFERVVIEIMRQLRQGRIF
jgi:hypothetical protein